MAETATQQAMRQHEDQIQRDRLYASIEQFSERWSPRDQNDVHRFHAELHLLVRAIHEDAQRPLVDTITNIMRTMPINPPFPQSR